MRFHHVYTEAVPVRIDALGYEGRCEECSFRTAAMWWTRKEALAASIRDHPQPPMVVLALREFAEEAP